MIVFIRSSLINRDVRAQKYIHFLDKEDILFVQWDRENESSLEEKNYITYKLSAGYGERLKSLFKFFQWNIFLFKTLFQNRKKVKVIQICDLDSFFGVVLFRLIGKKIIFDIYDFFTDSKLSNSGTLTYSILYHLEMFCLRFVDLLILPLEIRKKHLNFMTERIFVCENVPLIEKEDELALQLDPSLLNVIYAGTLEAENRGLEWIPSLAKKLEGKVHFYIAGTGGLTDFFAEASNKNSNITFLRGISHPEALSLQKKGDLIYGVYRTNLINNIMAAPNKFYESTYLGTPIVMNRGIMISKTIEKNGIGFVVGESEEEMLHFFNRIKKEQISEASANALKYWNNNYSNYINKKYKSEYLDHLSRLTST